jgi:hypothetical protein
MSEKTIPGRRAALAALALLGLALAARAGDEKPPAPAAEKKDQAPDLGDVSALEALVLRVEKEGWKRVPLDKLAPLPPHDLVFVAQGNTIDKEKAFRTAWIAAYKACGEDLLDRAAKLAADEKLAKEADLAGPPEKRLAFFVKKFKGKGPTADEVKKTLDLAAPRILEVERLAKDAQEKATFDQREADLKKFLKRYNLGPQVATADAAGTAVINVKLAPATYDLVKRTVYGWKFTPLKDAQGPVVLGGKRIEYTDQLSQGDVREALRMLTNEYFTVRYAKWEQEKEVDVLRVTGAKLLFGTYYFIEHEDRIVVAREPAAK